MSCIVLDVSPASHRPITEIKIFKATPLQETQPE
jgi:hypothetical protein